MAENSAPPTAQPDSAPAEDAALDAQLRQWLASHDGPVIVDLDETLCLRNSTQEFLDLARPAMLAALVLRLLQAAKPWRFTGRDTADAWRVLAIGLLFPWTFALWRRQIRAFARAHANAALDAHLAPARGRIIVATLGFRPIVQPLVAALGYGEVPLIACRWPGFADRRGGKLRLVERAIGRDRIGQSIVITDSEQDRPLLDACAHPHLRLWPGALYRRALARPYLPFDYVGLIKRPGKAAAKAIFIEDFTTWMIAAAPAWLVGWQDALALLLLFLSFWAVYEAGYADNDRAAARWEKDPTLSATYDPAALRHFELQSWAWALVLGGAAAALRGHGDWPLTLALGARWLALLVALRLTYALYNRIDKQTRVWLYLPLQLFRATAFVVLFPLGLLAPAFCGALAVSRWMSYYVYRLGPSTTAKAQWPEIPQRYVRFVLLLVLGAILLLSTGWPPAPHLVPAALGLAWYAVLARTPLLRAIREARFIGRA